MSSVTFQDEERNPGDKWMIRGPMEYVPPVEVEVVTKRVALPLDENEGTFLVSSKKLFLIVMLVYKIRLFIITIYMHACMLVPMHVCTYVIHTYIHTRYIP